jgi:hypothetical protein
MQLAIAVLWPSFLTAGVATILFFAAFDPLDLIGSAGAAVGDLRLGVYTVGFFLFWLLTAASSLLTCYFQRPPGR